MQHSRTPLWTWWLLALLLAPPASAQLPVSFDSPVQWSGEAVLDGATWLVVAFRGEDGVLDVSAPSAVVTNHTGFRTVVDVDGVAEAGPAPVQRSPESVGPGAVEAAVRFGGPQASLAIVARNISVEVVGEGVLEALPLHAGFYEALPDKDNEVRAEHAVGGHVGFAARDGARVRLQADGVEFIEWTQASVTCRSRLCPSGGQPVTYGSEEAGHRLLVHQNSFIRLDTRDGRVSGVLDASLLAAGGASPGLSLHGWLRLPRADMGQDCGCIDPGDGTLQAEGNLSLSGLRIERGRFGAVLSGDAASLRLDEAPLEPGILGGATVAVVAGALTIGLLAKVLAALVVDNRRRVHDTVRSEPGISSSELAGRLGLARGTIKHHLRRLKRSGDLEEVEYRGTLRYFENHDRYGRRERQLLIIRRDPHIAMLLMWVLRAGKVRQRDAIEHARVWGWKRPTTQRRLEILADEGLLRSWKEGGRWYAPT